MSTSGDKHGWHFLSNHAQVLLCIAADPDIRFRDIAQMVGITERAAQRIVADLAQTGYIERERVGRRNRYHLNTEAKMRHAAQADYQIGELIQLFEPPTRP
ncbi:MAG TPA: helix-turn-helix domain-containing protein [Gaiellaceae bacterium]|nr:helix-turn-helix domain-containing protein [Gaiellaceae bacterium]